jgi:hypothetical protein
MISSELQLYHGMLTNNGAMILGKETDKGPASIVSLGSSSMTNSRGAKFDIYGHTQVQGKLVNNSVIEDYAEAYFTGATISGTGSFVINDSFKNHPVLRFGSSPEASQSVIFHGPGELIFGEPVARDFIAPIRGLGIGDEILTATPDLGTGTRFTYHENSGHTEGTLTLIDGFHITQYSLVGNYKPSDFSLTSSARGSLIKFI